MENEKEFTITITGSAVYDPDFIPLRKKDVIEFQQLANVYFKKHRREMAELLEDLAPLSVNSAYVKNFNIKEVDVEA